MSFVSDSREVEVSQSQMKIVLVLLKKRRKRGHEKATGESPQWPSHCF